MSDWNYIKKIFVNSCHAGDPTIMIETAFEAVIPTLLQMADYTCGDIMKMRGGHTWGPAAAAFKALGVKDRRSGVRRLGGCGKKMFVEGGAPKAFGGVQIDQFKIMYTITGAAFVENALFKFFLFEVGKEFVINWVSLAYAAQRCDLPPAGTIFTTWDALFSNPEGGDLVCSIAPGNTHCGTTGGHEIHVDAGCQASINWSGEWVPFRNEIGNMGNVRMWLEDDKGKVWDSTTPVLKPGAMKVTQGGGVYNVPGAFPAGTTYRLKFHVEHGLMGPADSPARTLTVNTNGRPINVLPMGGCARSVGRASDQIWGFINDQFMVDRNGLSVNNRWYHPPSTNNDPNDTTTPQRPPSRYKEGPLL